MLPHSHHYVDELNITLSLDVSRFTPNARDKWCVLSDSLSHDRGVVGAMTLVPKFSYYFAHRSERFVLNSHSTLEPPSCLKLGANFVFKPRWALWHQHMLRPAG